MPDLHVIDLYRSFAVLAQQLYVTN